MLEPQPQLEPQQQGRQQEAWSDDLQAEFEQSPEGQQARERAQAEAQQAQAGGGAPAAVNAAQQQDQQEQEEKPLWTAELQQEFEQDQAEQQAAEQEQQQQEQQQQAQQAPGGEAGGPPEGWTPELQKEFEEYQASNVVGGHYPVAEGERFKGGRYTALGFLGQGHYSTVWRVRDESTGRLCAMKVVRSAPDYAAAGRDEVVLLSTIRDRDPGGASHCVRLLDEFEHTGPHGAPHVCEVFGVLGDDLLTLMRVFQKRTGRGLPLRVVRHIARQVLVALEFLHTECGIIHTDIKPENIMLADSVVLGDAAVSAAVQVDLQQLEAAMLATEYQLVDFGNAMWVDNRFTHDIQTRPYRAPEILLQAGFDTPTDIWSLGCLVWELVTGQYLFHPRTVGTRGRDRDHLLQMMRVLGHVPRRFATSGRRSHEFFSALGQLWDAPRQPHWPLDKLLEERHGLPEEEAMGLRDFLGGMLCFDPAKRATAAELLEHPWLRGELPQRPPPGVLASALDSMRSPSPAHGKPSV